MSPIFIHSFCTTPTRIIVRVRTTSIRANKKIDNKIFCTAHLRNFKADLLVFFSYSLHVQKTTNCIFCVKTIWNPNNSKNIIETLYPIRYNLYTVWEFLMYFIFTHKITFLCKNKRRKKCSQVIVRVNSQISNLKKLTSDTSNEAK